MRKPNYTVERKDRDRAKQAKAAAKLEKRTAKDADMRNAALPSDTDPGPAARKTATKDENG